MVPKDVRHQMPKHVGVRRLSALAGVMFVMTVAVALSACSTTQVSFTGLDRTWTFGGSFEGIQLEGLTATLVENTVYIRGRIKNAGTAEFEDLSLQFVLLGAKDEIAGVSADFPVATLLKPDDDELFEVPLIRPASGTYEATGSIRGRKR